MYQIVDKKSVIVIIGTDIVDEFEAHAICHKLKELLEIREEKYRLLVDIRNMNLKKSKLDIFIQYLSKVEVDRIALVMKELISKIKFYLWKRRYKKYVDIRQFDDEVNAHKWLKEEKNDCS